VSGRGAYFRSKAAQAVENAHRVGGPERTRLLEVARNWIIIAEIAETLDNSADSCEDEHSSNG
jgi:hypothetical protein